MNTGYRGLLALQVRARNGRKPPFPAGTLDQPSGCGTTRTVTLKRLPVRAASGNRTVVGAYQGSRVRAARPPAASRTSSSINRSDAI